MQTLQPSGLKTLFYSDKECPVGVIWIDGQSYGVSPHAWERWLKRVKFNFADESIALAALGSLLVRSKRYSTRYDANLKSPIEKRLVDNWIIVVNPKTRDIITCYEK